MLRWYAPVARYMVAPDIRSRSVFDRVEAVSLTVSGSKSPSAFLLDRISISVPAGHPDSRRDLEAIRPDLSRCDGRSRRKPVFLRVVPLELSVHFDRLYRR